MWPVSQFEIVPVNCVMMVEALENTGYIVDVTRDADNQKRSMTGVVSTFTEAAGDFLSSWYNAS